LRLDPAHGRRELVCEELDKDRVCELLALFRRCPVVSLPVAKYFVEARRRGLVVDDLCVLLADFEWLGDKIGDIFADEEVGVDVERVDLLGKI
jgi:hypothetical protein